MKIFITGITGFLGRSLALRMLELGHEVYGNDNFQHRRDIRFSDLTDQKQLNIKRQVQRQLIEKYRSFLGSLQNQGMRIDHLQIQMLEHFIDIVNSEDFDNLFNALMEDNLQLNILRFCLFIYNVL